MVQKPTAPSGTGSFTGANTPPVFTPPRPVTPVAPVAPTPVANAATTATPEVQVPIGATGPADRSRVLGLLILAVGAAAALWSYRVPVPAVRRLGGLHVAAVPVPVPAAAPRIGGLGRFKSEREGSPPPLL